MPANRKFKELTPWERLNRIVRVYAKQVAVPTNKISPLGEGGFSRIMKVEKDGENYAVKFSDFSVIVNEMEKRGNTVDVDYIRERVSAETKFLKTIKNGKEKGKENIIKIRDSGSFIIEREEIAYLEMELLESIEEPLEFREELYALVMGIDICNALICVHNTNESVHRDVKIANVLYNAQTKRFVLTDFNALGEEMAETRCGTRIGSSETWSPEVENKEPYSNTTDLYSLAGSIYWMLNEGKYFVRKAGETNNPQLPENGCDKLKEIIVKQMSYNRVDRAFKTADDFRNALFDILKERCMSEYDEAVETGSFEKASKYLAAFADRTKPEDEIMSKLGICYYKVGYYDKAYETFQKVRKISDFREAAYYLAGMYAEGLGIDENLNEAADIYHLLADDGFELAEGRLNELSEKIYEQFCDSEEFQYKKDKAFKIYAPFEDDTILAPFATPLYKSENIDERISILEEQILTIGNQAHISYIAYINLELASLYSEKYNGKKEVECYDRIIESDKRLCKLNGIIGERDHYLENEKEKSPKIKKLLGGLKQNDLITFDDNEKVRVVSTCTYDERYFAYVKIESLEVPDEIKPYKVMEVFADLEEFQTIVDRSLLNQILPELWEKDKTFSIVLQHDNSAYAGELKDGLPEGFGEERFVGGEIYKGTYKNGRRDGLGRYAMVDGAYYDGEWKDGSFEGRGLYKWKDGTLYNGDWKNNQREGFGIMEVANGDIYEGKWANEKMEGYGEYKSSDGWVYRGYFKNGLRNGRGRVEYSTGAVYDGEWENGKKNGIGTFEYSDGSKYNGAFKDGMRHGIGRMIYPANKPVGGVMSTKFFRKNSVYDGEWENDLKHGYGQMDDSNGDKYTGYWKNDQRHGKGKLITADGEKYEGNFYEDEFVGQKKKAEL